MSGPKKKPAKPSKRAKKEAPERQNPSGLLRWSGIVFLLLLAATAVVFFFVFPTSPGPGLGMAIEIDVGDESAESLARKLEGANLIAHPKFFALYLRLMGGMGEVAKGPHVLTDDASPREILHRLQRRSADHVKVVIPEGWTRFDIAKRMDNLHVCALRHFLRATEDPTLLAELHVPGNSVEGFLFPATYDVELDSSPAALVRRMVREFDKRYELLEDKHQSGLKDLSESLGWGRREIVTLASMVEKEAAVDDERPIIASVFLNRLRDPSFTPKLLQCDPTAGYGCLVHASPACLNYIGKITHEIITEAENPYNTYKHEGLPPGPIGSPGARSIEAVMTAAVTHFFYFVAKGGGRHTFSETLGGHNAAVHPGD